MNCAQMTVRKQGPNHGRKFLSCNSCSLFEWLWSCYIYPKIFWIDLNLLTLSFLTLMLIPCRGPSFEIRRCFTAKKNFLTCIFSPRWYGCQELKTLIIISRKTLYEKLYLYRSSEWSEKTIIFLNSNLSLDLNDYCYLFMNELSIIAIESWDSIYSNHNKIGSKICNLHCGHLKNMILLVFSTLCRKTTKQEIVQFRRSAIMFHKKPSKKTFSANPDSAFSTSW